MESIIPYAIWLAVILVALGILGIVVFGARNLTYGKINPISAATIAAPALIFAVLGLIMGEWDLAAIWTVVIMFVLASVALIVTGIGGLTKF